MLTYFTCHSSAMAKVMIYNWNPKFVDFILKTYFYQSKFTWHPYRYCTKWLKFQMKLFLFYKFSCELYIIKELKKFVRRTNLSTFFNKSVDVISNNITMLVKHLVKWNLILFLFWFFHRMERGWDSRRLRKNVKLENLQKVKKKL